MTNEQIIEALATEVMGWEKIRNPFRQLVWRTKEGPDTDIYPVHTVYRDDGGLTRGFSPLTDHNHMATIEAKMQQRGYKIRGRWDGCLWLWSYCGPPENPLTSEYGSIDKLMAEALAILQAVRK